MTDCKAYNEYNQDLLKSLKKFSPNSVLIPMLENHEPIHLKDLGLERITVNGRDKLVNIPKPTLEEYYKRKAKEQE